MQSFKFSVGRGGQHNTTVHWRHGGYNKHMPAPPSKSVDEPVYLPLCAIFRRFLKRKGHKFTTERALILDAVLARDGIFDAESLVDELRTGEQRASKATIYRTLKHLVEARIIEEVLIDPKQAHYQLCFGKQPVGHLVCVETQKVVDFPVTELEELRDRICKEHGYDPLSFRFVIYGLSPQAQQDAEQDEA